MKNSFLILVVSLSFVLACKTTKPTSEAPAQAVVCDDKLPVTYADIQPVFEASCNNCHSNGGRGGYDFTVFEDITRAAANGELMGSIKWLPGHSKMPRSADKLDEQTIAKIECWIRGGMKR